MNTFDLIQEITTNDGRKYIELGNVILNGISENAVENGDIENVKILALNILRSKDVINYEKYISKKYGEINDKSTFKEWKLDDDAIKNLKEVLLTNKIDFQGGRDTDG